MEVYIVYIQIILAPNTVFGGVHSHMIMISGLAREYPLGTGSRGVFPPSKTVCVGHTLYSTVKMGSLSTMADHVFGSGAYSYVTSTPLWKYRVYTIRI